MMFDINDDVSKLKCLKKLKVLSLADNFLDFKKFPDLRSMVSLETVNVSCMCDGTCFADELISVFPNSLKLLHMHEDEFSIDDLNDFTKFFKEAVIDCREYLNEEDYLVEFPELIFRVSCHTIYVSFDDFETLISYVKKEMENSSLNLNHVTTIEFMGQMDEDSIPLIFEFLEFLPELENLSTIY